MSNFNITMLFHFSRLLSLMKTGDIVIGGEHDESIRYIAPTVIINVKLSDPIMQEEVIFINN